MPQIGEGLDEDPRLKVLKKVWFEGKDCLDIGMEYIGESNDIKSEFEVPALNQLKDLYMFARIQFNSDSKSKS